MDNRITDVFSNLSDEEIFEISCVELECPIDKASMKRIQAASLRKAGLNIEEKKAENSIIRLLRRLSNKLAGLKDRISFKDIVEVTVFLLVLTLVPMGISRYKLNDAYQSSTSNKDKMLAALELSLRFSLSDFSFGNSEWENTDVYIANFYEYEAGSHAWLIRQDGTIHNYPVYFEEEDGMFTAHGVKGYSIKNKEEFNEIAKDQFEKDIAGAIKHYKWKSSYIPFATIRWDDGVYEIFTEELSSDKVGKEIGTIGREVYLKPIKNGDLAKINVPEGINYLSNGPKVYEIIGIERSREIAIELSEGIFYRCEYIGKLK